MAVGCVGQGSVNSFTELLKAGDGSGNYSQFVTLLRGMSPTAIDQEVRALEVRGGPVFAHPVPYLLYKLQFFFSTKAGIQSGQILPLHHACCHWRRVGLVVWQVLTPHRITCSFIGGGSAARQLTFQSPYSLHPCFVISCAWTKAEIKTICCLCAKAGM